MPRKANAGSLAAPGGGCGWTDEGGLDIRLISPLRSRRHRYRTASWLLLELGPLTPFNCKTRGQMADLAVRLTQAGAEHQVPLVRAAMAGRLRLAFITPGARLPLRLLKAATDPRPFAVILAGDGPELVGPEAFPQARQLLRWAGGIILHATGGLPEHYALAAGATVLHRRLVLVETCTAREAEWCNLAAIFAPSTPTLRITVRPSRSPHPSFTLPAGKVLQ
jgi:hypothetical protein